MLSRRRLFSLAGRAVVGAAALPFVGLLSRAKAADYGFSWPLTPIRHEVGGLEFGAPALCRGVCAKCGVGPMKYASGYECLDPAVDMQPGDIYMVTGDKGHEPKIYTICAPAACAVHELDMRRDVCVKCGRTKTDVALTAMKSANPGEWWSFKGKRYLVGSSVERYFC